MKKVTVFHIRSILDRKEKLALEDAIDLIQKDSSHSNYTRKEIEKALKKGIMIQLDDYTLQIVGIGYDKEDSRTIKRQKPQKGGRKEK